MEKARVNLGLGQEEEPMQLVYRVLLILALPESGAGATPPSGTPVGWPSPWACPSRNCSRLRNPP